MHASVLKKKEEVIIFPGTGSQKINLVNNKSMGSEHGAALVSLVENNWQFICSVLSL